jgi:hypothetical protein
MNISNQYQLKRHVHYNPYTGDFTRIQQPANGTRCLGKITGKMLLEQGKIKIMSVPYRAARLAHLYMTGKMPDGHIDHIDGDASNFRWDNLRLRPLADKESGVQADD